MPSTFVHGLLPPACVYTSKQSLPSLNKKEWALLLFISMVLANAPDLDLIPAALSKVHWKEIHRNWGHNIFALLGWITMGRFILHRFLGEKLSKNRCWTLATMLVLSHVFLDAMHDVDVRGIRRGVPLLWPLTSTEYALPFKCFKILELDPNQHFLLAHATSKEFWRWAFFVELFHALVIWALWAGLYRIFRIMSFAGTRLKSWRTNSKKETSETARPLPQFSPKYNPQPPSRLLPDGSLPHTNKDFQSAS